MGRGLGTDQATSVNSGQSKGKKTPAGHWTRLQRAKLSSERELRGHQGYKSIARTDDTGGSETRKKGEGRKQLNKDTQGNCPPHE